MLTLDLDAPCWSTLVGQCTRVTKNRADAEDAVQEAAVAVLRRLPALDPRTTNVQAYLSVAAHRAAIRVSARHRSDSLDAITHPIDPAPPVLETLTREETRLQVRAAINTLPDRQRDALLLFDVDELDAAQVGKRLGLPANAVYQLVSRARRSLRSRLTQPATTGSSTAAAQNAVLP